MKLLQAGVFPLTLGGTDVRYDARDEIDDGSDCGQMGCPHDVDGGLGAAERFVRAEFKDDIAQAEGASLKDHKTTLQEQLQAQGAPVPEYVVVEASGPSHRRSFRVQCVIAGEAVSEGEGYSKKMAEQAAAERALSLRRQS